MTLQRADFDQAGRYIQRAIDLLERDAAGTSQAVRRTLSAAIDRLSPGDQRTGPELVAGEVTVLSAIAAKLTGAAARTELLKAIAVLRDRAAR